MNIYNLIDNNSTTVSGPDGKDKDPAVVKAPDQIDFAKATPEQLQSYAVQLKAYNDYLSQNTQQTQQATQTLAVKSAEDAAKINEVIKQANAKRTAQPKAPLRAEGMPQAEQRPLVPTNQDIANMSVTPTGELVNPYPKQAEPDTNAMLANTPQIPENDGSQTIIENSKKVQELLGLTTPKFDEQKAERLKKIAAINAIGQGLSTAFGGYIGSKGGPILNTATNITPAALAEYNAMVEKDKDNKYRTNIMQVQEAVRGMHDVAANELNNRKANQKALEETSRVINKFKLDRYADNEKYRRDIDLLLFKYGIDVAKTARDNQYDEAKTKASVENQWKLARYNQGQANYRAKLKSDGTTDAPAGMVAYYNPQTGQRDYIERSKALYIIGKAKQERDSNDDPVYKMEDLITKPDKYNPEEMGLSLYNLLQKYGGGYSPKSDPLGIVDDANRPPEGMTEEESTDKNIKTASKANPFAKYGGTVVK